MSQSAAPVAPVEEWVKVPDGHELYSLSWSPAVGQKVCATILFTHGYGEHIGRYHHVFAPFAAAGIRVLGYDQRGFGQTLRRSKRVGHNFGYATVLADAKFMSGRVKLPDVPHFIMGHSMGGAIALKFAITYPQEVQGVISSAPLIQTGPKTTPHPIEYHLAVLASKVFGTLALNKGVDPEALSHDPAVVRAFREDPLVSPYGSLTTLASILTAGKELREQDYARLTLPVLLAHGSADTITCPLASKAFLERVPATDKEYKEYPGLFHELHNELGPDRDKVIAYYVEWIRKRALPA